MADTDTAEPTPPPPALCVDYRETALLSALGSDPAVKVTPLDVGDVEVWAHGAVRIVVERKTLSDLSASIRDGRMVEQRARMHAQASARHCDVLYVLETGTSAFAWDNRMQCVGVPGASLQGAVLAWMWPHGARVCWSRDARDTAAMLLRLHARLAKLPAPDTTTLDVRKEDAWATSRYRAAAVTAAVQARKRANLDAPLCFLQQLALLPGVSPRSAELIAQALLGGPDARATWCMASLLDALRPLDARERAKALTAVPGVGAKTAASVLTYLFGPPSATASCTLVKNITTSVNVEAQLDLTGELSPQVRAEQLPV